MQARKAPTFQSRRHTNTNCFTDKIDYRLRIAIRVRRFKISTVNCYPTSTDEKIEVNKRKAVTKRQEIKESGH